MPAFDNYDGSEDFWAHYELSRLSSDEKTYLREEKDLRKDWYDETSWVYVWLVVIYYSVLVIGGNEMQPAQEQELMFVVAMNILGLIFMTWIAGEIAVLVANISVKSAGL